MSVYGSPNIVKNGLFLCIDPANPKSWTGSGTSVVDLISKNSNTLAGTYGYDTSSYAVPVMTMNNNGTNSDGTLTGTPSVNLDTLAQSYNFSVMFAVKKNYYGIGGNNTGDSTFLEGATNGYNTGWRITEGRTGTPGAAYSSAHIFYFNFPGINTLFQITDSGSTNRMSVVGFTVTSSTITGFINGAITTTSNPQTYVTGTSSFRISRNGYGTGSWNGLVGFIYLYSRALSQAELNQNFAAVRGRYGL
jgi:hypothetical protein